MCRGVNALNKRGLEAQQAGNASCLYWRRAMTTTPISRRRMSRQAGFSATELIVVVAVIGILMAASTPFFISILRTSALRAGAEEFATVLGQARQLAIKDNTSMCVWNNGTTAQYRIGTCGGAVWTGPGTDAAGIIQLANNITISPAVPGADTVVFTYIGLANPVGFRVTNPQDGRTLGVSVAASGHISIGP
jgi:prepilin-type N-terminal cleavage/methylation domain-containing protein